MIRLLAKRLRIPFLIAALAIGLNPLPALAVTQQEWMVALVEALGRSYGLPDTPTPDDYINILNGKRNLRLEAEEIASGDDAVSRVSLPNFGPFSGKGWLLGISRPIDVHLNFVAPLEGRYRLAATLRSPGHTFQVGGQTFAVDGDAVKFSTVEVGEVFIPAGPASIVVTLPAGGALDVVTLAAPALVPIAPQGGWQPDAALTWDALALTAVQAMNLAAQLPSAEGPEIAVEAESLGETGAARLVEDSHLGAPSGGRWLRTSVQAAVLQLPLTLPAAGYYDLLLSGIGGPLSVLFNDHFELAATGKSFLDEVRLPPVYLPAGDNRLTITIPPRSGLDRIRLKPRRSDLAALGELLQLPVTAGAPTPADLDTLTIRLATATR